MSNRQRAIQPPPMWVRWALSIAVAIALIVSLVIAANRAGPERDSSEAQVEAETNRIADIAITEDEAPHTATLPSGLLATAALARAISRDVHSRIDAGQLTGPLQSVACSATGTASGGRAPYQCAVRSAGVPYSFLAVVEGGARKLTWCKVDPSATPGTGPEVLISPRCRV